MNGSKRAAILPLSRWQAMTTAAARLKSWLNLRTSRTGATAREVRRALRLHPRGGVAGDVLRLASLSLRLRVEWRARDVHPWDRDLPEPQQAQRFVRQSLADADAAIARLFETLPELRVADIAVWAPVSDILIMSGTVHRDDLLTSTRLSLEMRLKTIGMQYRVIGCRFDPIATPDCRHKTVVGL